MPKNHNLKLVDDAPIRLDDEARMAKRTAVRELSKHFNIIVVQSPEGDDEDVSGIIMASSAEDAIELVELVQAAMRDD